MSRTAASTPPERHALHPGGGDTTRAERARSEPMAVVPLGDGRYDVFAHDDHVYTVSLPEGTCTCPDHRHRGARCKHLRRVALDVTAGRVPAPGQRSTTCASCEGTLYVEEDEPDPVYCALCTLWTGEPVVDRETGDLVLVVRTTDRRAGDTPIPGTGYTVGDYPGNEAYDPSDRIVEVLYPLPAGLDPDELRPSHRRTYSFPRARLRRVEV